MSSMFGGDEVAKSQKQQQMMTKKAVSQQSELAKKAQAQSVKYLMDEKAKLADAGNFNLNFGTPGYGIQVDSSGGLVNRTGETQGFIDALKYGLGTDEAGYTNLLSQIAPGFGRLSQAAGQEIENAGRAAVGNLREQLARRRVLGASFANDQMAGLKATYDQMKQKAQAEAMVQELEMTQKVISARTDARNQTIAQALNQIQFEGDIGKTLTLGIMATNTDLAKVQAELSSLAAQITGNIATAQMGNVTGLQNTMIGSQPAYGQMAAEAAAGPANMIGTLLGTAISGGFGGIGSGGLMPAKSSTFPV